MSTIWPDVWAGVKKAARQAPRLYAAPIHPCREPFDCTAEAHCGRVNAKSD